MAQAKTGDVVKVHYTGKLPGGAQFDSSLEREPLEFTLGKGEIIPGFEQAVMGMSPGEKKTETIAPEQAYGQHRQEMIFQVERGQFPPEITPAVGQELAIRQRDGHSLPVRVIEVEEQAVTLDANHPLAGKDLEFTIELVEILSPQ